MITVRIKKDLITISGHAGYDNIGKDIVCAAASSIVITTVNACERLEHSSLKVIENKDLLTINVLKSSSNIKTLILNMTELLSELASDYPKNIKVLKEEE